MDFDSSKGQQLCINLATLTKEILMRKIVIEIHKYLTVYFRKESKKWLTLFLSSDEMVCYFMSFN